MDWGLGIGVYFVTWWVTGCMVIPFGATSQNEAGAVVPGSEPGAPVHAYIGRKVLANTLVAAIVWGIVDLAYTKFYLHAW